MRWDSGFVQQPAPPPTVTTDTSGERYRKVFEHALVGMCVAGQDWRVIEANPAYCRILGYSEAELLTIDWLQLIHPGDLEAALGLREHLGRDPTRYLNAEIRYIHRNGHVVWGRTGIAPILDEHGDPQYFVSHLEDITARHRAEEALSESEDRFRIMADSCPAVIWATNAE